MKDNSLIDKKLKELEDSSSKSDFWNITRLQGQFLSQFVEIKQPKNILEIGTSNGYSALHLVKNLREDSVLTTVEVDDKRFEIAKKNFEETKTYSVIKQVKGEIFELIENNIFENPFDLVFIDAAHKHYEKLFEKLQEKNLFAKNATIIFDNVISHSYMKQFIEIMAKKYQTIVIELGGGFLVVNL